MKIKVEQTNKKKTTGKKKPISRVPKIRIRIAGLYIEDGRILLVKHRKNNLEYYLLPGGGQEPGESCTQALKREWLEELNLSIEIGSFLFMGESVPRPHLRRSQVMQITFEIKKISGSIKLTPDGALIDWGWVPVDKISSTRIFPACKDQILNFLRNTNYPLYSRYRWLS